MQSIPLSFFVDFMLTTGTGRLAMVRQLKEGTHADFYRPVRDVIVNMHRSAHDMGPFVEESFDNLLRGSDPRERRIFPKVIAGYQKFLKQGRIVWSDPPMRDWRPFGDVAVRVAPELGLLIDGRPHAIQLHFRGDPPDASRIAATTSILASVLGPTWPGTTFALLDVRRARLYPHRPNEGMDALLRAEAAALGILWGAT